MGWQWFTLTIQLSTTNTTDISSVAIEQSSADDVLLVAGMLVADVLVLADDCTPYCIFCSLTSYEKIKKFTHTEAENTEK
jgi:hypothetical protein